MDYVHAGNRGSINMEQQFYGTISLVIDRNVGGDFLNAHDLDIDYHNPDCGDLNNREKLRKALESEIQTWLEDMNIDTSVRLEE